MFRKILIMTTIREYGFCMNKWMLKTIEDTIWNSFWCDSFQKQRHLHFYTSKSDKSTTSTINNAHYWSPRFNWFLFSWFLDSHICHKCDNLLNSQSDQFIKHHSIKTEKIRASIGLRQGNDLSLLWIQSYFSERQQYVNVLNVTERTLILFL